MIIVSQDRDKIINTDNVFSIRIRQINENKYYIEAYGLQSYAILGEYDSKEKTQEAFGYIIDKMGVNHYFAHLTEV